MPSIHCAHSSHALLVGPSACNGETPRSAEGGQVARGSTTQATTQATVSNAGFGDSVDGGTRAPRLGVTVTNDAFASDRTRGDEAGCLNVSGDGWDTSSVATVEEAESGYLEVNGGQASEAESFFGLDSISDSTLAKHKEASEASDANPVESFFGLDSISDSPPAKQKENLPTSPITHHIAYHPAPITHPSPPAKQQLPTLARTELLKPDAAFSPHLKNMLTERRKLMGAFVCF